MILKLLFVTYVAHDTAYSRQSAFAASKEHKKQSEIWKQVS